MPNLRGKTWTTTTPANVEDAQYWEDHLISDADAAKIGTVILPAGGTAGQVLTKQSSTANDATWEEPASSGHTIVDEDDTDMPYRTNLQFLNADVTDDSANDATVVDCKGAKGDPGQAATITIGTTTTLPAGSSATVTNSGTSSAAVFNFGIPKGADGSGAGDMLKADYDPNSVVELAGGIPDYVASQAYTLPTAASNVLGGVKVGTNLSIDGSGVLSATDTNTDALHDLTDVNISLPSDGQVLTYNNSSGKWENGTAPSTVDELSDLSDVILTTPTDGQALLYDSTNNKWVNGDVAGSASDITYDNTSSGLTATDVQDALDEVNAEKMSYADNTILGAKNLLPYPYAYSSSTYAGITFTVNNGKITISGTATDNVSFLFVDKNSGIRFEGDYIYSRGNGDNSTIQVYFNGYDSNGDFISQLTNLLNVSEAKITVPSTFVKQEIGIYVPSGTVLNNPVIISPMLRLASDTDDTYAPYTMTNIELTKGVHGKYMANGTSTFTFTPSGNKTIAEDLASAWSQFLSQIQSGTHDYYTIREFAVDGINHNNPNISIIKKTTTNVNVYFDYSDIDNSKFTYRKCKVNTSNATYSYMLAEITSGNVSITNKASTLNTKNIILRCYAYDIVN